MAQYHSLSKELQERILEDREKHKKNPYAFPDEKIVRRRMDHDKAICGVRHLCGMWRKLCMCRITTVIRIRRRYFPFTRMMTFQGVPCMFSSCHESQEISAVC